VAEVPAQVPTSVGLLYSPLRHMLNPLPVPFTNASIPHEDHWQRHSIHRNVNEWAGYTQIFHAEDPCLPAPPWHDVNWKHAGGADSFFQRLWSPDKKVRTSWNVLHLGPAGENWCGRASEYTDGTVPQDRANKVNQITQIWTGRSARRRQGLDQFAPEKLS
jgi:hypothetical protein